MTDDEYLCICLQGFVRPRALVVSEDGTKVYVADANEQTPECIWIFNRGENSRRRRHTMLIPQKGSNDLQSRSKSSQSSQAYTGVLRSKGLHRNLWSFNGYSNNLRSHRQHGFMAMSKLP